jgi:hypothetical protein
VAAIAASESQQRDDKIKAYRKEIIELHTCSFHTPSGGKAVVCYRDAVGTCYSLTEQDLNYWATLVVSLHIISISGLAIQAILMLYTVYSTLVKELSTKSPSKSMYFRTVLVVALAQPHVTTNTRRVHISLHMLHILPRTTQCLG